MWYVYLLKSGNRTYIGSTTNPHRRLRQHNGEIVGGARATRGKQWVLYSYLKGFENRSAACRWEKIIKSRARGLTPRHNAMFLLICGICPKGRVEYKVPENIHLFTMF